MLSQLKKEWGIPEKKTGRRGQTKGKPSAPMIASDDDSDDDDDPDGDGGDHNADQQHQQVLSPSKTGLTTAKHPQLRVLLERLSMQSATDGEVKFVINFVKKLSMQLLYVSAMFNCL